MKNEIEQAVQISLAEDLGSGDISAALIPKTHQAKALIISREPAVVAGLPWVQEVYRQVDPKVRLEFTVKEGSPVNANQTIATLTGSAQSLLTGERVALNWLQTLSATATVTAQYVNALANTATQLLDTRKTIPGLRYAQKYATRLAGAQNHRMGLYDAYLIKENHIQSAGSIKQAVEAARAQHPELNIEVEVENLDELKQALSTHVDMIMLDNFSLAEIKQAVRITKGLAKLEVSGNVTLESLKELATTGVDFISSGSLTKHIQAIDLSMRFI